MVGTAGPYPSAAFVRNAYPSARFFHPKNGPAAVSSHFLQFSYCHGLEVGYLRAVATFLGATAGSLFNWCRDGLISDSDGLMNYQPNQP
jgi:hypothetical protein